MGRIVTSKLLFQRAVWKTPGHKLVACPFGDFDQPAVAATSSNRGQTVAFRKGSFWQSWKSVKPEVLRSSHKPVSKETLVRCGSKPS